MSDVVVDDDNGNTDDVVCDTSGDAVGDTFMLFNYK